MKTCNYGCGKEALFTLKNGKRCCSPCWTQCTVNRAANSAGSKKTRKSGKYSIKEFNNADREKAYQKRLKIAADTSFVKGSTRTNMALKRTLINYHKWKDECKECGLSEWRGKKLVLELDHIDGDTSNNTIENLRFLCPNCHSLTDAFRGRSTNSSRKRVPDEQLIEALKIEKNIRNALIKVGLSPRGANYARAYKLKSIQH